MGGTTSTVLSSALKMAPFNHRKVVFFILFAILIALIVLIVFSSFFLQLQSHTRGEFWKLIAEFVGIIMGAIFSVLIFKEQNYGMRYHGF